MNRHFVAAAAAAAALLGGCAMHHHDPAQHLGDRLHQRPLITVRAGVLSVAPEPIVLLKRQGAGAIVWRLPAGYTFPDDGIEIKGLVIDRDRQAVRPDHAALAVAGLAVDREARRAFVCSVNSSDRQEFSCQPTLGVTQVGVYRYMIRVLKDGKERIEWDPNIFAMD